MSIDNTVAKMVRRKSMFSTLLFAFLVACAFLLSASTAPQPEVEVVEPPRDPLEEEVTQGALRVKTDEGAIVECPLKHTDVKADISGFIARVKVTQTFFNPYDEKIEAVYVFPLPHTAAVDDMTMVIGERRIVGVIKRRLEAREIYEQALMQGLTASLLEQERPNIFTQSVGNIKPKQEIRIEISYVDVLKYDMGVYEFHFPMVVGPRYIPGAPISKKPELPPELKGKVGETKIPGAEGEPQGTGWSPDTDRVPDASRITPPVLKPGFRTGHDISLSVTLEAGVPVQDLKVVNHEASVERSGDSRASVVLSPADSIPNKDFVMKYAVVGEKPEMAVLAHSEGEGEGYFMLMIQPRLDEELAEAPPREIVFLIDVSGSMRGQPTEKVKETMRQFFKLSKPDDTIQVITFSGRADKLFERPVPANEENIERALNFTEGIRGAGGTEMLKGIQMVLNEPVDPERVRIVVMLTDGFIGNEAEIIEEVGRRAGDQIRFWALGIGSSPNRFLIDGVAKQGGGMSAVIELNTDPAELVTQIVERIHRAQLAQIEIDWQDLLVYELYPRRIPELWAGRPVILFGRYEDGGVSTIELSGLAEGKPISYLLEVGLPVKEEAHEVLSKVWARKKIEDLSHQMFYADIPEVVEEITQIALEYSLMSQYTSFVAVDESEAGQITESPTPPRRMLVPVPLPEGVSYEGIFGSEEAAKGIVATGGIALHQEVEYLGVPVRKLAAPGDRGRQIGYYGRPARVTTDYLAFAAPPASAGVPATVAPMTKEVRGLGSYRYPAEMKAGAPRFAGRAFTNAVIEGTVSMGDVWRVKQGGGYRMFGGMLFQETAKKRHEEAKKALSEAQELQKQGKFERALLRYQHALLLETAFLYANPGQDDGTAAAATQGLSEVVEELRKARMKEQPALAKKLEVIIRDQSLEEAVEQIARAAGLKVKIVQGSLDDAAEMLNVSELRITYLDLRHATVAQALDWLLTPFHLSWRVDTKDTITVATTRRFPGISPWVYVVGELAIPLEKEIGQEKQQEKVKAALNQFLQGVRIIIAQSDDSGLTTGSAVLINPDQLLIYGDSKTHEKVAAFLKAIREPMSDVANTSGRKLSHNEIVTLHELRKATVARWAEAAEVRKKALSAMAQQRVLGSLETFSWQLLAAAAQGELSLEALTELQIAWKSPQLKEIIEGQYSWIALRAAWTITEAARSLPQNQELKKLGTAALSTVAKQFATQLRNLQEKPDDQAAYLGALYSVLSLGKAKQLKVSVSQEVAEKVAQAKALLVEQKEGTRLATARIITATLLSPSEKTDQAFMAALTREPIQGDDLVLLTALAAKERGGKVWKAFREEMTTIVGKQPLSGNVILLVNRLSTTQLASLTR